MVVGAGGAGMTAALAAKARGLDTVLIEKSAYFGGSTARSGGGVWIPNNYALKAAGQGDDPEASKLYLDSIVGDVVPKVRRDTYLERGPEVLDFIKEQTPLRFTWVPDYADYHPEAPGGRLAGRSSEPIPLDARFLGDELVAPAPAVHEGAGQPDRHPGRLPQDQPRTAHDPRPADDGEGPPQADRQPDARPEDVRDGQRDRDRPAQGPDRRRRAARLRHRAHRPGHRGRSRGRRPRPARRSGGRHPRSPRRHPRQRRLREEPRDAREVPAPADLGRLDDRLPVQHRRRRARRHRRGRRHRPDGRLLVGSDHPAAVRSVVLPGRAQPAGFDHRQPGRQPVHERGAAVRRGRARDLPGRGDRRRPRARLDGHRPALPQPLSLRRASRRANPSRVAGTRTARSRRPTRSPRWPRRSTCPRRR